MSNQRGYDQCKYSLGSVVRQPSWDSDFSCFQYTCHMQSFSHQFGSLLKVQDSALFFSWSLRNQWSWHHSNEEHSHLLLLCLSCMNQSWTLAALKFTMHHRTVPLSGRTSPCLSFTYNVNRSQKPFYLPELTLPYLRRIACLLWDHHFISINISRFLCNPMSNSLMKHISISHN